MFSLCQSLEQTSCPIPLYFCPSPKEILYISSVHACLFSIIIILLVYISISHKFTPPRLYESHMILNLKL